MQVHYFIEVLYLLLDFLVVATRFGFDLGMDIFKLGKMMDVL